MSNFCTSGCRDGIYRCLGFIDETTPDYQCNLGPDGMRRDADEWPDLCSRAVEFVAIRESLVHVNLIHSFIFHFSKRSSL
ncbi:Gelsolin domain-containing protein [Artemisia annua]|uniref:Gelsolin domain-containing protein n=1 Tax=Artemisia annua TaxID=35608 RepID=A0A2U1MW49_ARTAN|nr:Gelsolin domain-containing protein [Artemisia annua]